MKENLDIGTGAEAMLSSLDGDVQSQGIKVSHRDWLDMGSKSWESTDDKTKAAAYQAAKICGWEDGRLKALMLQQYKHLDQHMIDFTIKELQALAGRYPLEVEEVYDAEEQMHKKVEAEAGTLGSETDANTDLDEIIETSNTAVREEQSCQKKTD